MERLLTISIRKYLSKQPRTKRIRKTAKYVKDRVSHYIKIPLENVKIDDSLNRAIVKYYAMKMLPLRLKVDINNNIANVKLQEVKPATGTSSGPKEEKKAPKKAPEKDKKATVKKETAKINE